MRDYWTILVTKDCIYIPQLEQHRKYLSYCKYIGLYDAETFFLIIKKMIKQKSVFFSHYAGKYLYVIIPFWTSENLKKNIGYR